MEWSRRSKGLGFMELRSFLWFSLKTPGTPKAIQRRNRPLLLDNKNE
jgi:hypothetical protein